MLTVANATRSDTLDTMSHQKMLARKLCTAQVLLQTTLLLSTSRTQDIRLCTHCSCREVDLYFLLEIVTLYPQNKVTFKLFMRKL